VSKPSFVHGCDIWLLSEKDKVVSDVEEQHFQESM
jgi:hypothetical protein